MTNPVHAQLAEKIANAVVEHHAQQTKAAEGFDLGAATNPLIGAGIGAGAGALGGYMTADPNDKKRSAMRNALLGAGAGAAGGYAADQGWLGSQVQDWAGGAPQPQPQPQEQLPAAAAPPVQPPPVM